MTHIANLRLNRTQTFYLLEWDFEDIHRKALSYSLSFDDFPYPRAQHNLHDRVSGGIYLVNGQYPYPAHAFVRPSEYLVARILNIRIFDDHVHKTKKEIEHLRVLNSAIYLPMTKRYD